MSDEINPAHYRSIPVVECIDVVESMNFCQGNAIKYIWRAGQKGDALTDWKKARWYIQKYLASEDAEFPGEALRRGLAHMTYSQGRAIDRIAAGDYGEALDVIEVEIEKLESDKETQ